MHSTISFALACAVASLAVLGGAEARLGHEGDASHAFSTAMQNVFVQAPPQDAGFVGNIGGAAIDAQLGAADPCRLPALMDTVVVFAKTKSSTAEGTNGLILAAQKALHAEKNSPVPLASICTNASLPASAELRGILPLVDPSLPGAAKANQVTEQLLADILSKKVDGAKQATGKSVAQQMVDVAGFTAIRNFSAGSAGSASAAAATVAGNSTDAASTSAATTTAAASSAAATEASSAAATAASAASTPAAAAASAAPATAAATSGSADKAKLLADLKTLVDQLGAALGAK